MHKKIFLTLSIIALLYSHPAQAAGGDVLERANRAYMARRYQEAGSLVSKALAQEPGNAALQNLLGKVYHRLGKLEEAQACYLQALKIDGAPSEYHFNYGVALFDNNKFSEARQQFEEAVKRSPQVSDYQYNLAIAKERLGDTSGAMEGYERALRLDDKNAFAHFSIGRLLQKANMEGSNTNSSANQSQLGRAMQEYKTAISISPEYSEAYNNLGVIYNAMGNFPEAISCFQKALKLRPDCAEAQRNLGYSQAHTSLGITYFNQGDSKKAFEQYKKALSIDPEFADAHYNLALLLQKEGQRDEAVKHYRAAITLDPGNYRAHNNLGVALMQMGKNDEAKAEFESALSLAPTFQDAKTNLAGLGAKN